MNPTCEHCWSSNLQYIWECADGNSRIEEYECEDCWDPTFIPLD